MMAATSKQHLCISADFTGTAAATATNTGADTDTTDQLTSTL
jgi:hypothetical protein